MRSGNGAGAFGTSAEQLKTQLDALNQSFDKEVSNYQTLQQQYTLMINSENQDKEALAALGIEMEASIQRQNELGGAIELTNAQLAAHAKALNTVVSITNTLITITTMIVAAFDAMDTKAGGVVMGLTQIAGAIGIVAAA